MIKAKLVRNYQEDRTEGFITIEKDGESLDLLTIERPWRENKPFVSCIPEGTYIVEPNNTGKWRYYEITNVPNRTHIEIHPASRASQLQGCIAPCMDIIQEVAVRSGDACRELQEFVGDNSFELTITSVEGVK